MASTTNYNNIIFFFWILIFPGNFPVFVLAQLFFIGLLYGNLDETYEIIKKWSKKNILEAYFSSPSKGFNTEIDGKNILYWSDIFTKLSKEGLKSRNQLNSKKRDETIYLKNIDKMIIKKSTKAEDSIKNLIK